ncbi:hypothetical protein [Microbulbifer spongiae]|uniref:Uncharacterized protein n=1 Tax=Microbulbifer spongiae TaxID=2944933 RepID=A0ABY9E661_9GAMM|nr:hypothetical protein [Microbulbifer sp. MI-G]WKD48162.1 hypothetical protein M8T91_09375 [Microbulbifer sp. MI-G]
MVDIISHRKFKVERVVLTSWSFFLMTAVEIVYRLEKGRYCPNPLGVSQVPASPRQASFPVEVRTDFTPHAMAEFKQKPLSGIGELYHRADSPWALLIMLHRVPGAHTWHPAKSNRAVVAPNDFAMVVETAEKQLGFCSCPLDRLRIRCDSEIATALNNGRKSGLLPTVLHLHSFHGFSDCGIGCCFRSIAH